jgi:hypothetical protein
MRDSQGCLLDYKQLITTLTSLKKVTRLITERGMLSWYYKAMGLHYPLALLSPAND